MPKKKKTGLCKYASTLGEALKSFDLKVLREWMREFNSPMYKQFVKANEEVQMGAMCKMICNRTDLLSHECHKKAVQWLKEHNMSGRLF